MQQYMITANLPEDFSPELLMLIPKQREYVNQLFSEGKLSLYSLNEAKSKLWIAIHAIDEEELTDIIAKFPLIKYMDINYEALMFHNTSANILLSYGLN
jgi:muconolactone delta-isomerase